MLSPSLVRPTKRRRDDHDEKIEELSKVVNSMTGSKKTFLQAKLNNIKLKKQKLLALTCCRPEETDKQNLVTEFDVMIAENDIDIEIESIRNCKKFKRSKNKYFERLYRDSCDKENKSCNTSNEASTSHDCAEITNYPEKNDYICRQNTSNTKTNQNKVTVCNKGTNTEPVFIVIAKENIPLISENIFSEKPTLDTENNMLLKLASSSSQKNLSLKDSQEKEKMAPSQENNLETMLQGEEHSTILHISDQNSIQSKWFESSFEMDNFLSDKTEFNPDQDNLASKDTEKERQHKTYENKSKILKTKASSASQISKETAIEQNSVTSKHLIDGGKNTGAVAKSANPTLPNDTVSLEAVPLSQETPSSSILTLPKATNVVLHNSPITETEPKATHSHSLIQKLFGNYRSIYSPEKITNHSEKPIRAVQNDVNDNNNDKILTTDTVKPNANVIKETDCAFKSQSREEIRQQSVKPSKKYQEFKDIQKQTKQKQEIKNLPKLHQTCNNCLLCPDKSKYLPVKSQNCSVKSQDLLTKSQDRSAASQYLPAKLYAHESRYFLVKPHDLSTKAQDRPATSQDRPAKCQDHVAKFPDLSTKSQDHSAKFQDRPSKSQGRSSKSQDQSSKTQDSSSKSQNRSSKSQDRSSKYQDRAAKYQDRPAKLPSQELSMKSKDFLFKSQELPQKSSTESNKSHEKSSKRMPKRRSEAQETLNNSFFNDEKKARHDKQTYKDNSKTELDKNSTKSNSESSSTKNFEKNRDNSSPKDFEKNGENSTTNY